ncbi:hypothetical protein ACHWQZ_G007011 [Mnemiopsis leidyi]
MEPADQAAPLDLILDGDKKRKLEGGFKIPKKKRTDSESKDEAKPAVMSPVKEEIKKEVPKPMKIKKKKVTDLEKDETYSPSSKEKMKQPLLDRPPKLALLETPKMALLDTPSPEPEESGQPTTPPMAEEDRSRFGLDVPKSVILQEYVTLTDESKHVLTREIWRRIFRYLLPGSLVQCMKCCKVWLDWISDPIFWPSINLSRYGPIFPDTLKSVVLRQPGEIDLSYCTITRKQCDWLLPRLPNLKTIRLSGLPMNIIGSLNGPLVANLRHIDLRWVDDLNDWGLRDLLSVSSGRDHKPRFRDLQGLQLSGCPLSDDVINNIIRYCPNLKHLDLSYNSNMNDRVVEAICASDLIYSLTKIDFSGCPHVTDKSLLMMKKCYDLTWLDFRSCREVTRGACVRFAHSFKKELIITEDKLIHPPTVDVYLQAS